MDTTHAVDARKQRGRLLFPRAAVLQLLRESGLPTDEVAKELPPFVGVPTLARLLDVSPTWIRTLNRRGRLRGQLLKPSIENEAA